MSRVPTRRTASAVAGLVLALFLAVVAAPARGDDAVVAASDETAVTVDLSALVVTQRAAAQLPDPAVAVQAVADEVEAGLEQAAAEAAARAAAEAEARRQAAAEAAAARAARPAPPVANGAIDEIIVRHFGAVADQARRIVQCESNGNPGAVSPTNDHGLFQINIVHRDQFAAVTGHPWSAVYDPEINTRYAKWLYDQQGWRPWTCRKAL